MDWPGLVLQLLKLLVSYWGAEQFGESRQIRKVAEANAKATQTAFRGYEANRAMPDAELDQLLRNTGRRL